VDHGLTMLTLAGEALTFDNIPDGRPFVVRLSTNPELPNALRAAAGFLSNGITSNGKWPEGFRLYFVVDDGHNGIPLPNQGLPTVTLPQSYAYLADGDVVRVSPHRHGLRALYRRAAKSNGILLTERCNNYCLMCSQPPKEIDDSWLVEQVLHAIPLIDQDAQELILTGGEPTLLGDDLFRIVNACRSWLPRTSVHILSNGRRFADPEFTKAYAAVGHPDLMVGIPLYSDLSTEHDYVVQADGAFDETIRGILNLKRFRQRVELRVVIHKQTFARLAELAEFITRNLLFVDHVALMGLEITGFTRFNLQDLWIDPVDYQEQLWAAVSRLSAHRMNVSIYNHQLCVLDRRLWRYAKKSISDWKNEYFEQCDGCSVRDMCGGFFSSASIRHSDHIHRIA
jgi:His-Xaa-Ser system radical SAM maturase HxsC